MIQKSSIYVVGSTVLKGILLLAMMMLMLLRHNRRLIRIHSNPHPHSDPATASMLVRAFTPGRRSSCRSTPPRSSTSSSSTTTTGFFGSRVLLSSSSESALSSSSSLSSNTEDATVTATEEIIRPMDNLYRTWTVEQDQLLWTQYRNLQQQQPKNNNKNTNNNNIAELSVLLGRGIRGVEQRLVKLKDVQSSAYQRLFVTTTTNTNTNTNTNNARKNSNNHSNTSEDRTMTTTTTMKTSQKLIPVSEVLRRIEWDPMLRAEEFYILHYDRVDKTIVRTSILATNTNISSSATSFVQALPEHRIVAVQYRERIVWDRRHQRKYDIFFGGTSASESEGDSEGGIRTTGIRDVIATYDDWKHTQETHLAAQRCQHNIWSRRWRQLLQSEVKPVRLYQCTKDLIRTESSSTGTTEQDVSSSSSSSSVAPASAISAPSTKRIKQHVDSYLHHIMDLFRDEDFYGTFIDDDTVVDDINTDAMRMEQHNTQQQQQLISLLDELSEWVASPYWFTSILESSAISIDDVDIVHDDDNDDNDNNNNAERNYRNSLREILLQKIASTMDRLEGKQNQNQNNNNDNNNDNNNNNVSNKKQKQKQKQKQDVLQNAATIRRNSIQLNEKDIDETFVKGQGSGGQKINKTSNRVVLVHVPTQVRVECQDTRSLSQNRKIGRKRLIQKLDQYYHGTESKQALKEQKLMTKKRKKKAKNKARLHDKLEEKKKITNTNSNTSSNTTTNGKKVKKLSKKQQLLLRLQQQEEEEEEANSSS